MHYLEFGNTGLTVSKIGLGMAALGRPGYINLGHHRDLPQKPTVTKMKIHAHHMMSAAYDLGIRYFDAARSYGKSELFLGSWIRDRENLVLGSKWGYTYTANWEVNAEIHEVKEHTLPVLNRQWHESLTSISRHPDIYHIHSATSDSGVLKNLEVIERLWQLKEMGVIIGLSTSGPGQAETIERSLEIKSGETYLFQSLQLTWNLLEKSASRAAKKAFDAGYGIIIKEALANGRLTDRNKSETDRSWMDELNRFSRDEGITIDQLAMQFVLQQPWAHIILSGAGTREQLQSNVKSLGISESCQISKFLNGLEEGPDNYWARRSSLAWN
jgi:aryl-alcohol dehydrogenase-like predicted oxidoreductase